MDRKHNWQGRPNNSFGICARRFVLTAAVALLACQLTGCSLFVMAGKMFFGDPKIKSDFQRMTGVNLTKDGKKVLLLATTPEAIKAEMPALNLDLVDGLARRFKLRGIPMVDPDKVAGWLDRHGGQWDDLSELAQDFDADYIIHFQLDYFAYREENSPSMYRGRAQGSVHAYEVRTIDGGKAAMQIFVGEFRSEYPRHHPVSAEEQSEKVFIQRYLDYICDEFGRKFYDYRMGDGF